MPETPAQPILPKPQEVKPLFPTPKFNLGIDVNDPSWARIIKVQVHGIVTIDAGKSDKGNIGDLGFHQGGEKAKGTEPPPAPVPETETPKPPKLTVPVPEPDIPLEPDKKIPTEVTVGIAADPTKVDREEANKINFMMGLNQQKSSVIPVIGPIAKMIGSGVWQNTFFSPAFREREARWLRNVMRDTGISDVPNDLIVEAIHQGNLRVAKRNWLRRNIADRLIYNVGSNIWSVSQTTNKIEAQKWIKEQVDMARGFKEPPEGVEISPLVKKALFESSAAKEATGGRFSIEDSKDGIVHALRNNEMRIALGEKREGVADADLEVEKQLSRQLQQDFVAILKDYLNGDSVSPEEARRRIDEYSSPEGYTVNGTVYKLRERLEGKYNVFQDKLTVIGNSMVRAAEVFRMYKGDYVELKRLDDKFDWERAFAENKLKLKFYVGEGEINAGKEEGLGEKLAKRLNKKEPRVALSARENHSKNAVRIAKSLSSIIGNEVVVSAVAGYGTALAMSLIPTSPSKAALLGGAAGGAAIAGAEVLGISTIPVLFAVTAAGAPVVIPAIVVGAAAAGVWAGAREFFKLTRERSHIEWESAHGIKGPSLKQAEKLAEPGFRGKLTKGSLMVAGAVSKAIYGKHEREGIMKDIANQRKASDLLEGLTVKSKLFKDSRNCNSELPEDISKIKVDDVKEALRWLTETQARLDIVTDRNRFVIEFGTELADAQQREVLAGASIAVEERLIELFRKREDLRTAFGITIDASGKTDFITVYTDLKNAYTHNILGDSALPDEKEYEKLVKLVGEEEIGDEKQIKGFINAREAIARRDKIYLAKAAGFGLWRAAGTAVTAVGFRDALTEFKHFIDNKEPPSYLIGQMWLHQAENVPLPEIPVDAGSHFYDYGNLHFHLPQGATFDQQNHIITAPDHSTLNLDDLQKQGPIDENVLGKAIGKLFHRESDVLVAHPTEAFYDGTHQIHMGQYDVTLPKGVEFVGNPDGNAHQIIDKITLPGNKTIDLHDPAVLGHAVDTTKQADLEALQRVLQNNHLDFAHPLQQGGDYRIPTNPDTQTFGSSHSVPTPLGTHWAQTSGQPPGHFDLVDSNGKHLAENAYFAQDGKFNFTDQSGSHLEFLQNPVDKHISDNGWITDLQKTAADHHIAYGDHGIGFRVDHLVGNHGVLKLFDAKGQPIDLGVSTPNMPRDMEIEFHANGQPPDITYAGITQNSVPDVVLNALKAAGAHGGGKFDDKDFWPPRINDSGWDELLKKYGSVDTSPSHLTHTPTDPPVPWHPNPQSGEAFPFVKDAYAFIKEGNKVDMRGWINRIEINGKDSFIWHSGGGGGGLSGDSGDAGTVYHAGEDAISALAKAKNGDYSGLHVMLTRPDDGRAIDISLDNEGRAVLPDGLNINDQSLWASIINVDKKGLITKFMGFGPDEKLQTHLDLSKSGWGPITGTNLKAPLYNLDVVSQKENVLDYSLKAGKESGIVAYGETPTPATSYADMGTIPEGKAEVGVKPVTPAGGWQVLVGKAGITGGGRVVPLTAAQKKEWETKRDQAETEVKSLYAQVKDYPVANQTEEQKANRLKYEEAKRKLNEINARLAPTESIVAVPGLKVLVDRQSANEYQDILLKQIKGGNLKALNEDRKSLGLRELTVEELTLVQTTVESRRKVVTEMVGGRVTAEILEEKKKMIKTEVEKEPVEQVTGEKLEDLYKKYSEVHRIADEKQREHDAFVNKFADAGKAASGQGYDAVVTARNEAVAARDKAFSPLKDLETRLIPQAIGTTYEHLHSLQTATHVGPVEWLVSGGIREKMVHLVELQTRGENTDVVEKELKTAFEKFIEEMEAADTNYKHVTFEDFKKNHAIFLSKFVTFDATGNAKLSDEKKTRTDAEVEAEVNARFQREKSEVVRVAGEVVPKVVEHLLEAESVPTPIPVNNPPPKPDPKPKPDDNLIKDKEIQKIASEIKDEIINLMKPNAVQFIQLSAQLGRQVTQADITDEDKRLQLAEDLVFWKRAEASMTVNQREAIEEEIFNAEIKQAEDEDVEIVNKYDEDEELKRHIDTLWSQLVLSAKTPELANRQLKKSILEFNSRRKTGKVAVNYSPSEVDYLTGFLIQYDKQIRLAIEGKIRGSAQELHKKYKKSDWRQRLHDLEENN